MVRKNDNVELESTEHNPDGGNLPDLPENTPPPGEFDPDVIDESGGSDDEGDQKPHIGDGVHQADGEIDKTIADDTQIAYVEDGEQKIIPRSEYQEKGLG